MEHQNSGLRAAGDPVQPGAPQRALSWWRVSPRSFLQLILIGFSLVATPLIAVLIHSAVALDRLAAESRIAVRQSVSIAHASRELADDALNMERAARQSAILGDPALLEAYYNAHAQFERSLAELSRFDLDAGQRAQLAQLRYEEDQLYQRVKAAQGTGAALLAQGAGFSSLLDAADAFSANASRLIEQRVDALEATANHDREVVFWQVLALVPVVLALAAAFSRLIARPIRQIDLAIHRMGQGKLANPVTVSGPQDLRMLGARLDWLRRRLLGLEAQNTEFLQHVSHELKTPLTAIREGSDLLSSGVAGALSPQQARIAGILFDNSLRLQRQIEELLQYSALQNEKSALVKVKSRLVPLVEQVVDAWQLAIMNQLLHVERRVPDVIVECDEQKFRTIVDNLLSNAIRFSPQHSTILIQGKVNDGVLELVVADEGPGVGEADRQKVFEPFYQAKRPPHAAAGGTGLGLAIAREYALAHGGDLQLLQHEGSGAHFCLRMPLNGNTHV